MFFHTDIKGDRLPRKTLCLTFDDGPGRTEGDGPGPRTLELADFLADRGIRATFFVVGRHAEAFPEILPRLKACGHLVGNHTYSHPGLVSFAQSGGDVVEEIARTDAIIRDDAGGDILFLRAPYGNWRETTHPGGPDRPTSILAAALNAGGRFPGYVGPINWDICNEDWTFWGRGLSGEACARSLVRQVRRVGRGIVLMHDSSEDESARRKNRALQAISIAVPILEARGYSFVGLDEIPQVVSAAQVSSLVALRAPDGRYVSARDHIAAVAADALEIGAREQFGVVDLGENRVALRAGHGLYLSPSREGPLVADAPQVGEREILEKVEREGGRIAFRMWNGRELTMDRSSRGLIPGATGASFETLPLFS